MSAPGTIAGTAAYMAPEQATGGTVDARSDIFSFGAMLYEMVTGQRAFAGTSTAETLSAVIRAQPKPPSAVVPGVPSDLEKVILRCLRKDPERRFQHIGDVKVALQDIKEESDSGARLSAAPVPRAPSYPADRGVCGHRAPPVGGHGVAAAATSPPRGPAVARRAAHDADGRGGPSDLFARRRAGGVLVERRDGRATRDIYVTLVGSSDVRRLTTDPLPDLNPAWSPDGRQIAFLRAATRRHQHSARVSAGRRGPEAERLPRRRFARLVSRWSLVGGGTLRRDEPGADNRGAFISFPSRAAILGR